MDQEELPENLAKIAKKLFPAPTDPNDNKIEIFDDIFRILYQASKPII
jgi:hypothetical protein